VSPLISIIFSLGETPTVRIPYLYRKGHPHDIYNDLFSIYRAKVERRAVDLEPQAGRDAHSANTTLVQNRARVNPNLDDKKKRNSSH